MSTSDIVEPHEIVKANNELFRCKYRIKDVLAARIFMAFASLVDHKDVKENQSFVEYKIAADSILSHTCMGGDNYKQLKDAAYSLVDHKIELRISKSEFYFYTLFSKIGYKDGMIIGEFHKDLMPFFLIAKEKFTKVKLTEYIKLPSIYSQYIFVFLKSWSDKDEISVSISQLHEMLNTPQSFRKDFRQFRTRVLEKAHKDINEHTSLKYEWEPIKVGRSVQQIKFIFIKPQPKKINASPQAQALVRKALGAASPEEFKEQRKAMEHGKFLQFLARFKHKESVYEAGSMWQRLHAAGKAPMACDVSDGTELSPLDFLVQWQKEHGITLTSGFQAGLQRL